MFKMRSERNVTTYLLFGLISSLVTSIQLNLAMITVHVNYAKRRLDILRLLSMSDGRNGRHNLVKQGNYCRWDYFVSETVIEKE